MRGLAVAVWLADCCAGWQVYMQPGEMVLYEGARLHHGRPMGSWPRVPPGAPIAWGAMAPDFDPLLLLSV